MNKAISWNKYFMELAKLSAQRSKDPKTQVGACIVDPEENHIVSIGYNGLPKGMPDSDVVWDDKQKHKYVVHAEANAILNTNQDLHGKKLYVTMFPCNECAKLIVQKGITEVIYLDSKYLKKESGSAAMTIFNAAGVEVLHYEED